MLVADDDGLAVLDGVAGVDVREVGEGPHHRVRDEMRVADLAAPRAREVVVEDLAVGLEQLRRDGPDRRRGRHRQAGFHVLDGAGRDAAEGLGSVAVGRGRRGRLRPCRCRCRCRWSCGCGRWSRRRRGRCSRSSRQARALPRARVPVREPVRGPSRRCRPHRLGAGSRRRSRASSRRPSRGRRGSGGRSPRRARRWGRDPRTRPRRRRRGRFRPGQFQRGWWVSSPPNRRAWAQPRGTWSPSRG